MSTTESYSGIRDTESDRPVDRLAEHADDLHDLREMAVERGFDALVRYIDAAIEEVDA